MYNLGLQFKNLGFTKTKIFLNLGLKSFVIWACKLEDFLRVFADLAYAQTLASNFHYFI